MYSGYLALKVIRGNFPLVNSELLRNFLPLGVGTSDKMAACYFSSFSAQFSRQTGRSALRRKAYCSKVRARCIRIKLAWGMQGDESLVRVIRRSYLYGRGHFIVWSPILSVLTCNFFSRLVSMSSDPKTNGECKRLTAQLQRENPRWWLTGGSYGRRWIWLRST